jgi:2,4-dienoyl-CoA reductase-like NADH-dependent reductase (Old Yellow Enzyme family)
MSAIKTRGPQFAALATPFELRGVSFRNRFVQAPMCAMYSAPDGSATPQNVEYYRARAAGGVGLCIVEITFTDDRGSRAFPAELGAHNDTMIPGLSDIAEAIRSEGAWPVCSSVTAVRNASFRKVRLLRPRRFRGWQASACPFN